MITGIDASGRAIRWEMAVLPDVKVAFAVQGCPPYDRDEQILWNSPESLRSQINHETLSLEAAWRCLLNGDQLLSWRLSDGTEDHISPAKAIAQVVKAHCPVQECGPGVALAVPNLLDEDGQDALLTELASAGLLSPLLLWRPVAVALDWLCPVSGVKPAFCAGKGVWVLDFDSAGMELTILGTCTHARDAGWIAPVRHYPSTDGKTALADGLMMFDSAWGDLFPGIGTLDNVRVGPQAPVIQEQIESSACGSVTAWTCSKNRWQRSVVNKCVFPKRTVECVGEVLSKCAPTPEPGDVILVHGWCARLWPDAILNKIKEIWPGVRVDVMPADAVASGAKTYALRRAKGLPTYYDSVPEYKIWCKTADGFGWKTVVEKNDNIEPGFIWQLNNEALQTAFGIPRYRDRLSLLVQRQPVLKPETDFARRLCVDLSKMAQSQIALRLNATIAAAQGNAKFTVSLREAAARGLFADDRLQVELSYGRSDSTEKKLGAETIFEPEHKGYLEAQPVIGRVHDSTENLQLLDCIVKWLVDPFGHLKPTSELAEYRKDLTLAGIAALNDDAFVQSAIDRWGYDANPRQPTRGLFGTRFVANQTISILAEQLVHQLWGAGPVRTGNDGPSNRWAKRHNWCHIYAGPRYRDHVRGLLCNGSMGNNWSEAFAAGYVLGDHPGDLDLFIKFNLQFGFGDQKYRSNYWWSFFRMLCWHPEVHLELVPITNYLEALVQSISSNPIGFGGGLTKPWDLETARKNALFVILFALRVRETIPNAVPPSGLLNQKLIDIVNQHLNGVLFPKGMIGHMHGAVAGNLSQYVIRFLKIEDTLSDRELGAGIAEMSG